MPKPRSPIALLGTLALAACASVPLSSIVALRRVDFQTTDFAKLRVAVQLPDAIRTRTDGVRMIASISYDGGVTRKETLYLREANLETDKPSGARRGFHTHGFSLREADVVRLEAIRAEIAAAKAEQRKGSLGFGIEAREFCRAGELGNGPVPITTFLRTAELPEFIPLLKDFDLRSDAHIGEALAKLPPC
jgi:hypothetical protein